MSNLERLKQRLEESLEKHKNRLLKTRHKKAKGLIDGKATKSTNYTGEESKKIDTAKNEITNSGRVKRVTTERNKNSEIYDVNNLKGRLIERSGSPKAPQVRGKKESNIMPSGPLKDKLYWKGNSSRRVIRESRGTYFVGGKTNRDVAKGGGPDPSEANHAVGEEEERAFEERALEERTLEEHSREEGDFDGVSKEIRDNLNDLFRHFINCKINNLYVINGDRGKLPRGEFAEEGRGVMMIPGVGASEEVQEGVIGEVVGEKNEMGAAFPDDDEVGCENHARGEAVEGLYSRLCHVKGSQSNVNGEGDAYGVSRKGDTSKETQLIGANIGRGGKNATMVAEGKEKNASMMTDGKEKNATMMADGKEKNASIMANGRVTPSSESVGADIESGRYNSTFVKLMQIKKKIKKKIKKFEDEGKGLLCTDERTVCNSDASNEERDLPIRDLSTFTDGNVSSAKGFNHWGVVRVDSSVASAASTNQEASSTGESIELFTTQKNIFVCNYYTKNSRRKGRRREGGVHVVSDAANFLGSAFSLASHSTATCDVGGGHSAEYAAHFNPHKPYGGPTHGRERKRQPARRSSTQGERVTQGRGSHGGGMGSHGGRVGSHEGRIPDEGEGRAKRRDNPGKTKYEFSSCPSNSLSNQSNYLSPSGGKEFKFLRDEVRRGLSTHMGKHVNDGWSPVGERHSKWETLDWSREPRYANENRALGPKQSSTCVQERSKCEIKSVMQCEMNTCNERSGERKEGANRFPICCLPSGEEVPWKGAGVRAPSPVQWDKCSGEFSGAVSGSCGVSYGGDFSGERGGESATHRFVELHGERSRPGDGPREGAPLYANRTKPGATPSQLTPSAHQSCEEQAKCYICSFPIRNSEEEFVLKKKKKDSHVGRMEKGEVYKQKGEAYKQKECTSKRSLRKAGDEDGDEARDEAGDEAGDEAEADLLYRRNRCEVSHPAQGEGTHGGMVQGDMLTHKGRTNRERGILRSRQTIYGDSGEGSCMADQEGEGEKMETPERYIEIKDRGVEVHRTEDNAHGVGTNLRYRSVGESHKREEAIGEGGGFSLEASTLEGGLQRSIPICAVKRSDGLNKTRNSQGRKNPVRDVLHERRCSRQEPSPSGVAPRDVDRFSEAYNTWVYKERISASAEREGASIGSGIGIVNERTRDRKPKTIYWKISEGDTFNFPVEGGCGEVPQVRAVLQVRPAERHQKFGTEGGINRSRAASNGAFLKKVLRMKIEAMRREKGNRREEAESRKVMPPVSLAQIEHNAHNVPNEERDRLSEYGQRGRGTPGEAKQMNSGGGEGWVRDELSVQMGGTLSRGTLNGSALNMGTPNMGTLNRGTHNRGPLNRGTLNRGPLNRGPLSSDPPSRVERDAPREMAPPVGSPHVQSCSVRSVSTLERIPSSGNTHRKYSPRSGLTRKAPARLRRVCPDGVDKEEEEDDDKDDDADDDDDYKAEVQRFNESYYCNLKRIKSDDVYPNSEEPISTSEKRSLMEAYLQDLRRKKEEDRKGIDYKLRYNIEFFKFAQLICQDKNFCSNYLGQMGSNMVANGDDIDRIAFSIVKLFNSR